MDIRPLSNKFGQFRKIKSKKSSINYKRDNLFRIRVLALILEICII